MLPASRVWPGCRPHLTVAEASAAPGLAGDARGSGFGRWLADHHDGTRGVVDAVLADRAEQGFGESAVPAAADHQQLGSL